MADSNHHHIAFNVEVGAFHWHRATATRRIRFAQLILDTFQRLHPAIAVAVNLQRRGQQLELHAFFFGMAAFAHGLWRLFAPAPGAGGRWRTLGRHALIAVVALALVSPVAVPLAVASATDDVPGVVPFGKIVR